VIIKAHDDNIKSDSVETITIKVLDNDEIADSVEEPEVKLVDENNNRLDSIENDDGIWEVNGTDIIFSPSDRFGGGDVHVDYALGDGEGHYSNADIWIEFPIAPSLPCPPLVELNSTNDVLYVLQNMPKDEDGRIEFDIDKNIYTFNADEYDSIDTIDETSILNPLYWVEYDYDWNDGEKYPKVEKGSVTFDFANETWEHEENETTYVDGTANEDIESDSGTYELDGDVYRLSLEEDGNSIEVWSPKFVSIVEGDTLQAVMDAPQYSELNITIEDSDKAMITISKATADRYEWWDNDDDQESANDLDEFISNHTFDSNASEYDWDMTILHNHDTWQKVLVFAEGSSGNDSGALVELDAQNNVVINDNAGTWKIVTVDGVDILVVEVTVCGYSDDRIYKVEDGKVIRGDLDEKEGEISISMTFNESLANKIQDVMADKAKAESSSSNSSDDEDDEGDDESTEDDSITCSGDYNITTDMLANKVFYIVEEEDDEDVTYYTEVNITSESTLEVTEARVDENNDTTWAGPNEFDYHIDDGDLVVEGADDDGDYTVSLTEDPQDGDWSMCDGDGTSVWFVTKPDDFPEQEDDE